VYRYGVGPERAQEREKREAGATRLCFVKKRRILTIGLRDRSIPRGKRTRSLAGEKKGGGKKVRLNILDIKQGGDCAFSHHTGENIERTKERKKSSCAAGK